MRRNVTCSLLFLLLFASTTYCLEDFDVVLPRAFRTAGGSAYLQSFITNVTMWNATLYVNGTMCFWNVTRADWDCQTSWGGAGGGGGVGGGGKYGASPYLYNDSTHIYVNSTYLNLTIDDRLVGLWDNASQQWLFITGLITNDTTIHANLSDLWVNASLQQDEIDALDVSGLWENASDQWSFILGLIANDTTLFNNASLQQEQIDFNKANVTDLWLNASLQYQEIIDLWLNASNQQVQIDAIDTSGLWLNASLQQEQINFNAVNITALWLNASNQQVFIDYNVANITLLWSNASVQWDFITGLISNDTTLFANASAQQDLIDFNAANITNLWSNASTQWLFLEGLVSNDTNIHANLSLLWVNASLQQDEIDAIDTSGLWENASDQWSFILGLQANDTTLFANASAQQDSIDFNTANITNLWSNASVQWSFIKGLISNDTTIHSNLSLLWVNASLQQDEIDAIDTSGLWENASDQWSFILGLIANDTTLFANASEQQDSIDFNAANITNLWSNASEQWLFITGLITNDTTIHNNLSLLWVNASNQQVQIDALDVSGLWQNASDQWSFITGLITNDTTLFANASVQWEFIKGLITNDTTIHANLSLLWVNASLQQDEIDAIDTSGLWQNASDQWGFILGLISNDTTLFANASAQQDLIDFNAANITDLWQNASDQQEQINAFDDSEPEWFANYTGGLNNDWFPTAHNTYSLGLSYLDWSWLYLSGNITDDLNGVTCSVADACAISTPTPETDPQFYGNLTQGVHYYDWKPNNYWTLNLGNSTNQWYDLWLSHNLTDGTASCSVEDACKAADTTALWLNASNQQIQIDYNKENVTLLWSNASTQWDFILGLVSNDTTIHSNLSLLWDNASLQQDAIDALAFGEVYNGTFNETEGVYVYNSTDWRIDFNETKMNDTITTRVDDALEDYYDKDTSDDRYLRRVPACEVELYTWADLEKIRFDYTASYCLMENLTSADDDYAAIIGSGTTLKPFGNSTNVFTGVFNGNGKTIEGLKMYYPSSEEPVGLFGLVSTNAIVYNVELHNVNVTGCLQTGALVGAMTGGTLGNNKANGTVNGVGLVGGLVGIAGTFSVVAVENPFAHVEYRISDQNTEISDSTFTGNVTKRSEYSCAGEDTRVNLGVGGLIGGNGGFLETSSANTTITIQNNSELLVDCVAIGGLVGLNSENAEIENSHSTTNATINTATTTTYFVGGLVGANGNIWLWDDGGGGYLFSADGGSIKNTYALGIINGTYYVGGLIGINGGVTSNSYSADNTSAILLEGGFVGSQEATATENNCSWYNHTNNPTNPFGNSANALTYKEDDPTVYYDSTLEIYVDGPSFWDFLVNGIWLDEVITYPSLVPVVIYVAEGTIEHDSLSNLAWSLAGHFFDTTLDLGTQDLMTSQTNVLNVRITPFGIRYRNILATGGWDRGFFTYEDEDDNNYFRFAGVGSGQDFSYSYIGVDTANWWQRWYVDQVLFNTRIRSTQDVTIPLNDESRNYTLVLENPTNTIDNTVGISFRTSTLMNGRTPGAAILFERTSSNSVGKLHLGTRTGTGNTDPISVAITIDASQRVGVNSTSPSEQLYVDGNIRTTKNVTADGYMHATDFLTSSKVADVNNGEVALDKLDNIEEWIKDGKIQYDEHYAHTQTQKREVTGYDEKVVLEEKCVEVYPDCEFEVCEDIEPELKCEWEEVTIKEPVVTTTTHDALSMETRIAELEKMVWELKNKIAEKE